MISVSLSYKLHGRFISIAKDLHGRLKSRLNNDFVQNLHLNRAGATTETRLSAFLIIHSVARVAPVCLAFVAVARYFCDHLAVYVMHVFRDSISCMSFVTVLH